MPMENLTPLSHTPAPRGFRRLDRPSAIFLSFFLIFIMGILVFVFSVGPTYEKLVCRRSTGECEITESYFFGLAATRKRVFPQETISSARIKKVFPSYVGNRRSPPMILELVFKDGTSYPTVDFGFRPWTQKKVDEFNRYLRDTTIPEITVDSLAPLIVTILLSGGLPLLVVAIVGFIVVKRKTRSSKG